MAELKQSDYQTIADHLKISLKELIAGLGDPMWRINNLYQIVDKKKKVVTFRLNRAQKRLFARMHTRNVILKARKMGFSTAIQIFMLDTAMWSPNERCMVIAQDLGKAETIFRDVFKFAYDRLPEPLKNAMPIEGTESKSQIRFKNNSIVEVDTSARSGTPTFLHISEFGKIAAKDPGKAREIVTGSITAAPEDALIFVESTAEGQDGEFYKLVATAMAMQESGAKLWKTDFQFHFFGWWEDPSYEAPTDGIHLTDADEEMFEDLEQKIKVKLNPRQKAWYVRFRDVTYSGNVEMMWSEFPGTPEESWRISLDGAYFNDQLRRARKEKRIDKVPYDRSYPVNIFWDIGANDQTALWFIQNKRTHYAVIDYMEASGEAFEYFVRKTDEKEYLLGYSYIPHDANHKRQGAYQLRTAEDELREAAPHYRTWGIERTPNKVTVINMTRNLFSACVFDERRCKLGLKRLSLYRKEWNLRLATWRETPRHDENSNGADAFLLFGQAVAEGHFQSAISTQGGPNGAGYGGWIPEADLSF